MSWGSRAKFLEDEALAGMEPKALVNKPEVPFYLLSVYDGFWVVSRGRSVGFGIGPIPPSEVYAHMDEISLEEYEDREDFLQLILVMDDVYLEWAAKEAKKK